jgi:hypothetical protein
MIDQTGAMWNPEWETFLTPMPKATTCVVMAVNSHRPVPLRFVWHHVQPLEAGGPNIPANQVEICDSCHYSIHRLMWCLAGHEVLPLKFNKAQMKIATTGYDACVAAGTVGQIPDEG